MGRTRKDAITAAEGRVLEGIAAGMTYPAIAKSMNRSYETIKTYTNRLRSKIGVSTKAELAAWAKKNKATITRVTASAPAG